MAYQTFGAQITSLTGMDLSNSTNQGYVDSYLTNAARDILNMVPSESLITFSITSTLDDSPTTFVNAGNSIIISVVRKYDLKSSSSQVGRYRECRPIPASAVGLAEADSGYLESYSVEDPIYYIQNNTLYVSPTPDATHNALVHYIHYPTVLYSESTVDNFPKLLEQAVVYRAAADAARFLFQDEQDEDIFVPMIKDLTNQFANSLKLFLSKFGKESPVSQQAVSKKDQLSKMLGG